MKRTDAEQLALGYCRAQLRKPYNGTRPAHERAVLNAATAHYGSALTAAARRRIRVKLREGRPNLSTTKGKRNA